MSFLKRTLSDLDQIKASTHLKNKTLYTVMQKKPKKQVSNTHYIFALASVVIFVFGFLLFPRIIDKIEPKQSIDAYVSVDINPSMEFRLDNNNKVIDIIAYNEEAKIIIETVNVKGMNVENALLRLLENENILNYMELGYMRVGVYTEDEIRSAKLEASINQSLSTVLKTTQYSCARASKIEYLEAENHHLSFGKYQVIELILELNQGFTIEELKDNSIRELKEVYESLSGESLSSSHQENNGQQNGCENGKGHHCDNDNKAHKK